MVRRGTRGIADVMQNMKRMLQEKSSNDNIMEYIQVSLRAPYLEDTLMSS